MSDQLPNEYLRQAAAEKLAFDRQCPPQIPPLVECPKCGFGPLAYKRWHSGLRTMMTHKCRECGWGQSGTW